MNLVSFQSQGLIDPLCISTIGVSVKENENPIGYFGTGLKYAIAIILREGGTVTVWRGLEPLRFTSRPVEIRGKVLNLVCMNDVDLGFTTDLGKHWKVWQALREIHCNTKDEGGEAKRGTLAPSADTTTVHVDLEEFAKCFGEIGKYILQTEPLYTGKQASFHAGPSAHIFYRSIQVASVDGKPSLFTINLISPLELTEDRTMKSYWYGAILIARAVLECEDEEFLERWLSAPADYEEHERDLDWGGVKPSTAFLRVARKLASDPSRPLNKSAIKVLAKHEPMPAVQPAILLGSEKAALQHAISFCHGLAYTVDEFPIVVVESLGVGTLGKADTKERRIYIARRAFQMGDLTLASTLIEEWAHIKHGLKDCTRDMQNWVFEALVRIGEAYLYERDQQRKAA